MCDAIVDFIVDQKDVSAIVASMLCMHNKIEIKSILFNKLNRFL